MQFILWLLEIYLIQSPIVSLLTGRQPDLPSPTVSFVLLSKALYLYAQVSESSAPRGATFVLPQ